MPWRLVLKPVGRHLQGDEAKGLDGVGKSVSAVGEHGGGKDDSDEPEVREDEVEEVEEVEESTEEVSTEEEDSGQDGLCKRELR